MFVRAIRGATTVNRNDKEEILSETKYLLESIIKNNQLQKDDLISILFTVTQDLDATFPAISARSLGLTDVSLLCMNEINVPNSLEKCIRVLVYFNTNKNNDDMHHIYLNNAKSLRPDLEE
jgi:chorismate mutase